MSWKQAQLTQTLLDIGQYVPRPLARALQGAIFERLALTYLDVI